MRSILDGYGPDDITRELLLDLNRRKFEQNLGLAGLLIDTGDINLGADDLGWALDRIRSDLQVFAGYSRTCREDDPGFGYDPDECPF